MTWSYSGVPTSSPLDNVRFLVQDVNTSFQMFSNEEINAVLDDQPIPTYAAASLLEALSIRYALQVDKAIGQTRISLSRRSQAFAEAAARLRAGGPGNMPGGDGSGERAAVMFVGGLDVAGNEAIREDSSVEQSSFKVGQDDRPGIPLNRKTSDTSGDPGIP